RRARPGIGRRAAVTTGRSGPIPDTTAAVVPTDHGFPALQAVAPVRRSILPPRTRYRPPCFAMMDGTVVLYPCRRRDLGSAFDRWRRQVADRVAIVRPLAPI